MHFLYIKIVKSDSNVILGQSYCPCPGVTFGPYRPRPLCVLTVTLYSKPIDNEREYMELESLCRPNENEQ